MDAKMPVMARAARLQSCNPSTDTKDDFASVSGIALLRDIKTCYCPRASQWWSFSYSARVSSSHSLHYHPRKSIPVPSTYKPKHASHPRSSFYLSKETNNYSQFLRHVPMDKLTYVRPISLSLTENLPRQSSKVSCGWGQCMSQIIYTGKSVDR